MVIFLLEIFKMDYTKDMDSLFHIKIGVFKEYLKNHNIPNLEYNDLKIKLII